jgi:hypothetical protein
MTVLLDILGLSRHGKEVSQPNRAVGVRSQGAGSGENSIEGLAGGIEGEGEAPLIDMNARLCLNDHIA